MKLRSEVSLYTHQKTSHPCVRYSHKLSTPAHISASKRPFCELATSRTIPHLQLRHGIGGKPLKHSGTGRPPPVAPLRSCRRRAWHIISSSSSLKTNWRNPVVLVAFKTTFLHASRKGRHVRERPSSVRALTLRRGQ